MFLLKCPKCGHSQKYQPASRILTNKRKKCVYCNFSIDVTKAILKKI